MPFLISTGVEKPNPEARKLIRSHVMLGRNQGKTLRFRRRQARESADKSSPGEEFGESSGSLIAASQSVILPKIGSDLTTVRFADAVEPYMIEIILQCEWIPPFPPSRSQPPIFGSLVTNPLHLQSWRYPLYTLLT